MARLFQTLLDSLTVGSLYALIALGYTMVYGILQFINFAHSDIFMLGAWFSYTISSKLGWKTAPPPIWSAPFVLLATMGICGSIGFAIERLAYKPLRRAPRLNVLITAIGVSLLIENVGQLNEIWIPYVSTRVRHEAPPADWQPEALEGAVAAFAVPRADGDSESARVSVVRFSERDAYRGHGDDWADASKTTESIAIGPARLVAEIASGTYVAGGARNPHFALVATCADGRDETLTTWLLGPEKSVAKNKDAFLSWAGSVHLVGPLHCFGTQPQSMPALIPDVILKRFEFLQSDGKTIDLVNVRLVDVLVIGISVALMVALQWLVFKTKLGLGMRAVSYDTRIASLMGINVDLVISFTFVIGSALAAAAGLLFSLKYSGLKQPADSTWVLLGLKAFVAAVVGGIGNVRGAVLGGLLIGLLEQFGVAYVSPQLRDVYVFALLILVLLVKPTGILGKPVVEKV